MQPSNTERVNLILEAIARWVDRRNDIMAAALVGSWARGTARLDSDIDLMFLTHNPSSFRQDDKWIDEIQRSVVNAELHYWEDKDYGAIWSRHIYFEDETAITPRGHLAIEFGFGFPSWAAIDPVDPGTFRVISDGCRILFDPEHLLHKLIDRVNSIQTASSRPADLSRE